MRTFTGILLILFSLVVFTTGVIGNIILEVSHFELGFRLVYVLIMGSCVTIIIQVGATFLTED